LTVAELLAVMVTEADDSRYRRLAFLLTGKGQALKLEGRFDELFPVLLGLLNHNADETRSEFQRHAALASFRELAAGAMTDHLLDHLQDEAFTRQEIVYLLLHHLGGAAVADLVDRIVAAESEPVRKNLTTAVLRIGPPAVAPLLNLLQSTVWQVVRVTAAVLGHVGGREAARGLALAAYHRDNRVRSEAIRSLATIGGREATETLLGLLQDSNPAIRRLAILWLGISRNDKAVEPLLDLVTARDLLCKSALLKKEALRALGRIGDRRVLPTLYRVVRKRHLLAAGRWRTVQMLAVESIGRLGGQEARAFLSHMVDRRGLIGTTCRKVLESMEQEKETSNG
jgi:HEAT repeat protein